MLFSDYTEFANIKLSERGYPRLIHNGYSYGVNGKTTTHTNWQCTRCEPNDGISKRQKRCIASIQTKVIDGYEMIIVRNPHHTCPNDLVIIDY